MNGFIATDPDRLVGDMQALLAEPALARAIGAAGRRTALERFSIGRFVRDWDTLLQEACGPVGLAAPGGTGQEPLLPRGGRGRRPP